MSDFYNIIPVKENIYRITSIENVFCELLVGTEKALLIDTGYAFGNLKEIVKQITDKPLYIVNTHGHLDHICGNWQFKETVYISAKDLPIAMEHSSRDTRHGAAIAAKEVMDYQTGQMVCGLPKDFDLDWYLSGTAGNLKTCSEGDIFDLGGMTIRVIETPGHTEGGISLYYEEENWLYAGDEVNGFVWLFMPEATNRSVHIQTLNKILELNPTCIYGAHAPFPMTCEHVKRFIQAAENADYEKGLPFEQHLTGQTEEARICLLDGCTMEQIGQPNFASIVIAPSKF